MMTVTCPRCKLKSIVDPVSDSKAKLSCPHCGHSFFLDAK